MVWECKDAWERGFLHAQEYALKKGDLEVPNAHVCADGYRLGKWISNQRCAYMGIATKRLTEKSGNKRKVEGKRYPGRIVALPHPVQGYWL